MIGEPNYAVPPLPLEVAALAMKRLILAGAGHPKGENQQVEWSHDLRYWNQRKKYNIFPSPPGQPTQVHSAGVETAFKPTHSEVDPASPAGAWNAKRKVGASMVAGLRVCAMDLVAGRNGFERLENPQALWLAEKDIEQ